MTGEFDLNTLLREMQPVLDEHSYVIAPVSAAILAQRQPICLGVFHESEGTTVIVTSGEAARLDIATEPQWAHITLSVHSSLSAVGFIARIATALAAAGISLNPVAGYYHDHLFVPWSARNQSLQILQDLARASTGPA